MMMVGVTHGGGALGSLAVRNKNRSLLRFNVGVLNWFSSVQIHIEMSSK